MSRKRRQKEQLSSNSGKKARIALGADNQLFRGKKKSLELVARAFAPKPLKSERFRPQTVVECIECNETWQGSRLINYPFIVFIQSHVAAIVTS